jgi:hypothetical protein
VLLCHSASWPWFLVWNLNAFPVACSMGTHTHDLIYINVYIYTPTLHICINTFDSHRHIYIYTYVIRGP